MEWKGVGVLIIGAARQGTSLGRYLAQQGARVRLNDMRSEAELAESMTALDGLDVDWALGGHGLEALDGMQVVCPSGGVPLELPLVAESQRRGLLMSNDSQVFLEAAPCKVIGITGSAGKTTTTTLVGRMAEAGLAHSQNAYRKVWVGGNIGEPLIDHVNEMDAQDLAVMELSSFQLEIMTRSPQIAVVLNVTPNHLDRHITMEAYTAAKKRILDHQTDKDTVVFNRDDPVAAHFGKTTAGKSISFGVQRPVSEFDGTYLQGEEVWLQSGGKDQPVMHMQDILLRGEHNLQNVLAACAIAAAAGVPTEAMKAGVTGFRGVEHRLELVREWGGAEWYNDSIATAPERSMAAMKSFDAPMVLLAGGQDKDLPWEAFGEQVRQRVDHLIAFGEAAEVVIAAVKAAKGERQVSIAHANGLAEAVAAAVNVVEEGDVVLLSPGGTSFDEFVDFAVRGDKFKELVMAL
ncbi:MAG: UDP-N-acetylmuramoyl-L-alanine--D-glutamate ligase [Anaerolineae bacterium]|nr:UDP-N-acetylmuramoyl-L-alanine--D-glutamate ligase [Anaerolineae bacterium]